MCLCVCNMVNFDLHWLHSCDGREVKALDLKSNGVSPSRLDPCSQRRFGLFTLLQTLHSLRCIARTVRTQNTWDDRHQNGVLRPAGPLPIVLSSCINPSCKLRVSSLS